MSHLDYLNRQEWKKLGILSIISLFTPSIFFIIFGLILSMDVNDVSEIGTFKILQYISLVSVGYSLFFSILSFFIMYFKGEAIFRKLVATNFMFLIGFIFIIFCMVAFGPHG